MDLIFRSDTKLKPLVRLGLALSAFEQSLGHERRVTYQAYRDQAHSCGLDVEAVRMITAEIDCQSARPAGTRLAKILDAAQRITALGDVMVGGSQNLVACGVWASLRLTLVVSLFSEYLWYPPDLFSRAFRQ
jgi:ankyrin repeat domain-containing protein 50